jgi:hypothetical protein
MTMRVGVAPGTTAFVVSGPDFSCLNCGPGGFAGVAPAQGPIVNGRLDMSKLGICPPDPVVQFLTNPFLPDSTTPSQYRTNGGGIPVGPGPRLVPVNPYGTDSTFMGASPLGVSWKLLAGILGTALVGGGVVGWATRKKRKKR